MENTKLTVNQLANYFDNTNLHADATKEDMRQLCEDSAKYGFKMVAINPVQSSWCRELLGKDSPVDVGAAIGFPLGQNSIETKAFETTDSINNGANEIDYVINITELKAKNYAYIEREMQTIVDICRKNNVMSKVIFENCYLTDDEKTKMCEIALKVRPDFIKTSTGFGTGGATVADVKLMKSVGGDNVKVKAAGGISDLDTCLAMIAAGAERIGTSHAVALTEAYKKQLEQK